MVYVQSPYQHCLILTYNLTLSSTVLVRLNLVRAMRWAVSRDLFSNTVTECVNGWHCFKIVIYNPLLSPYQCFKGKGVYISSSETHLIAAEICRAGSHSVTCHKWRHPLTFSPLYSSQRRVFRPRPRTTPFAATGYLVPNRTLLYKSIIVHTNYSLKSVNILHDINRSCNKN